MAFEQLWKITTGTLETVAGWRPLWLRHENTVVARLEGLSVDDRLTTWAAQVRKSLPSDGTQSSTLLRKRLTLPVLPPTSHVALPETTNAELSWAQLQYTQVAMREHADIITSTLAEYQRYCEYLAVQGVEDGHNRQDFFQILFLKNRLEIQLIDALAELMQTFSAFGNTPAYGSLNGSLKIFERRWHAVAQELSSRVHYVMTPLIYQLEEQNVIMQPALPDEFTIKIIGAAISELSRYHLVCEGFYENDFELHHAIGSIMSNEYVQKYCRDYVHPEVQAWVEYMRSKTELES